MAVKNKKLTVCIITRSHSQNINHFIQCQTTRWAERKNAAIDKF